MQNSNSKAGTKVPQSTEADVTTPCQTIAANPLLAVRCIHPHEDGLTKGKIYDAYKSNDWGFDIFPDDNGYLSGWDKRYFEVVGNDL